MLQVLSTDNRIGYQTSVLVGCTQCGWQGRQTDGMPDTCPLCDRNAKMAELNRVLEAQKK